MKRQKHVFDTCEIPHLWAHKTQENARNKHGNLYFEGDTIYSYGSHFPIARHSTNEGQPCVLFTTRTYSVTTRGHIYAVKGAIPKYIPIFFVDSVSNNPTIENIRAMEQSAAEFLAKAKRARENRTSLLWQSQGLLDSAAKMAEFFGIKYTAKNFNALNAVAAEIDKARQEASLIKRQQEAKRRAELAQDLELWKAGGKDYPYSFFHSFRTAFARISADSKEVETTKGARIPVEHAVKAWPLVKRVIETGQTYCANGHTIHLGNYAIRSIDIAGNLTVGCHVFDKAEVLRIGSLLTSV